MLDDGAPITASLGAVIVHLPQQMSRAGGRLLQRLASERTVKVNVGLTGEPTADEAIADHLARLGIELPHDNDIRRPVSDHIVSVSDPDEEVRTVVRLLVDAMRDGVRCRSA